MVFALAADVELLRLVARINPAQLPRGQRLRAWGGIAKELRKVGFDMASPIFLCVFCQNACHSLHSCLIHFTNVLILVKGHGAGVSGQTFHDREKGRKTLAAAGS